MPATLSFFDENDPDQQEIRDRLEETFENLEELPMHQQNWDSFLSGQAPIVVISTGSDGIRKSAELTDMLLSSLYAFKQHERGARLTIILDEIEDLCKEKDAPIPFSATMKTKGSMPAAARSSDS